MAGGARLAARRGQDEEWQGGGREGRKAGEGGEARGTKGGGPSSFFLGGGGGGGGCGGRCGGGRRGGLSWALASMAAQNAFWADAMMVSSISTSTSLRPIAAATECSTNGWSGLLVPVALLRVGVLLRRAGVAARGAAGSGSAAAGRAFAAGSRRGGGGGRGGGRRGGGNGGGSGAIRPDRQTPCRGPAAAERRRPQLLPLLLLELSTTCGRRRTCHSQAVLGLALRLRSLRCRSSGLRRRRRRLGRAFTGTDWASTAAAARAQATPTAFGRRVRHRSKC